MAKDMLDGRHGVTPLLPSWYVDLDPDHKRKLGSLVILGVLIPCLVIAW
ncbi:MAG: hypothetical protein ACSLFF_09370 [Solirubrobacterales bacterium]